MDASLSWILQSGMINKVAVTDAQGFDQVAPEPRGLSHADKGYCTNPRSNDGSPKRGVHLAAVKINNRREKKRRT